MRIPASLPHPGLVEQLEEQVVLPLAGDAQVPRGDADGREPALAQHPLGGGVVQQGAGLQPVQAGLAERPPGHRGDRGGGDPAAGDVPGDPVAEVAGEEGPVDDVVHADPPDRPAVQEDPPGQDAAEPVQVQQPGGVLALELLGPVLVRTRGVPRREVVAVGREQGGEDGDVVLADEADGDVLAHGSAAGCGSWWGRRGCDGAAGSVATAGAGRVTSSCGRTCSPKASRKGSCSLPTWWR